MADARGIDLESLPDEIGAWSRAVPETSDRLLRISDERLLQPRGALRDVLTIGKVGYGFRIYLAKSRDRVRFFRSRRDAPSLVLDTSLKLVLAPTPANGEKAPRIEHRLAVPAFILLRPTMSEVARFGPPGATGEDTVFFKVGPAGSDILAVRGADDRIGRVAIRYTTGDTFVDIEPSSGRWPMSPFLALSDAIRSWIAAEQGDESLQLLRPPSAEDRSEPRRILFQLIRAYRAAAAGVAAPRAALPPMHEPLRTDYGVRDCTASILLRLRADGSLAETEDDDPFQLLMGLEFRRESDAIHAVVSIRPPDFLVSGELHHQFLGAIAKDASEEVAAALGISAAEARRFVRAHARDATVFRTRRLIRRDIDVVVVPGRLNGKRHVIIMSARFRVMKGEPTRVVLIPDSVDVECSGSPDSEQAALDSGTAGYFIRLAASINDWIRVIP